MPTDTSALLSQAVAAYRLAVDTCLKPEAEATRAASMAATDAYAAATGLAYVPALRVIREVVWAGH